MFTAVRAQPFCGARATTSPTRRAASGSRTAAAAASPVAAAYVAACAATSVTPGSVPSASSSLPTIASGTPATAPGIQAGLRPNTAIVEALTAFPDFAAVTELDFSRNLLGPVGVLPVLAVIRQCLNLRRLCLDGNNLNNDSVEHICDAVRNLRHLTELGLSCNPISTPGGRRLELLLAPRHAQATTGVVDGRGPGELKSGKTVSAAAGDTSSGPAAFGRTDAGTIPSHPRGRPTSLPPLVASGSASSASVAAVSGAGIGGVSPPATPTRMLRHRQHLEQTGHSTPPPATLSPIASRHASAFPLSRPSTADAVVGLVSLSSSAPAAPPPHSAAPPTTPVRFGTLPSLQHIRVGDTLMNLAVVRRLERVSPPPVAASRRLPPLNADAAPPRSPPRTSALARLRGLPQQPGGGDFAPADDELQRGELKVDSDDRSRTPMRRAATSEGSGTYGEEGRLVEPVVPPTEPPLEYAPLPPDRHGLSLLIEAARSSPAGPGDALLVLCTAEHTHLPEDCENPFPSSRRGLWLLAEAARYIGSTTTADGFCAAQSPIRLGMGLTPVRAAEHEADALGLRRQVEAQVRQMRSTGSTFNASVQRMIAAGAQAAHSVAGVARQTAQTVNDVSAAADSPLPPASDARDVQETAGSTLEVVQSREVLPTRMPAVPIDFDKVADPFVSMWFTAGAPDVVASGALSSPMTAAAPLSLDAVMRRAAAAADGVGARGHY